MGNRFVKTELKDEEGRLINPVSSFTRFGFWTHGPRSYLAALRSVTAATIGITIFADWGLIDAASRYGREPMDGESIWFWFRPQDWIHGMMFLMLVVMIVASGFKRVDSEMDTQHPYAFLFIWNCLILLIPLTASSFIMYYHVLRFNKNQDDAYEATILEVFIAACFELLWGGWPSSASDVALPCFAALAFIVYTIMLSRVFGTQLYSQLDWRNKPSEAGLNAFIFMLVTFTCAATCTIIAKQRNKFYARLAGIKYDPVEKNHLNPSQV